MSNASSNPADKARQFFDDIWRQGDFWAMESSAYERDRFEALFQAIAGRRYGRVLEVGCGAGAFTRLIAPLADYVLATDVSPEAIARAQERQPAGNVEFKVMDIMATDALRNTRWDLIVVAETIYYLGWLHPFFNVAWLAWELHEAVNPGGHLLLANTQAVCEDMLILPWLIKTYHDLFLNVGFVPEVDRIWTGIKDGVSMDVRISLLNKKGASA